MVKKTLSLKQQATYWYCMLLKGDRERLGLVRRGCGIPEESWKNFGPVLRVKTVVCSPITLLGNTVELRMKEVLYEVRCLKSNEDMILALAGQFKQLSREPEKFR